MLCGNFMKVANFLGTTYGKRALVLKRTYSLAQKTGVENFFPTIEISLPAFKRFSIYLQL